MKGRWPEEAVKIFQKHASQIMKYENKRNIYSDFYLYFISGRISCTPNIPLAVKRIQCV